MKAAALIALIALGSCEFAQKHPAVTVGIAGGVVGFMGCETDGVDTKYCAEAGGAAAIGLFTIAALVTFFFDTGDNQPIPEDEEELQQQQEVTHTGAIKVHTHTAPPPVVVDAGVTIDAIAPDAAVVDAP
jgi:hypothetical protein